MSARTRALKRGRPPTPESLFEAFYATMNDRPLTGHQRAILGNPLRLQAGEADDEEEERRETPQTGGVNAFGPLCRPLRSGFHPLFLRPLSHHRRHGCRQDHYLRCDIIRPFRETSGEKRGGEGLRSDFASRKRTLRHLGIPASGKRLYRLRRPEYRRPSGGGKDSPARRRKRNCSCRTVRWSADRRSHPPGGGHSPLQLSAVQTALYVGPGGIPPPAAGGQRRTAAIFRRIFDTGLYRALQNDLAEQSRQLTTGIEAVRLQIADGCRRVIAEEGRTLCSCARDQSAGQPLYPSRPCWTNSTAKIGRTAAC